MQEGPEWHPAAGHSPPASSGQAWGHGSAGAARHRGKNCTLAIFLLFRDQEAAYRDGCCHLIFDTSCCVWNPLITVTDCVVIVQVKATYSYEYWWTFYILLCCTSTDIKSLSLLFPQIHCSCFQSVHLLYWRLLLPLLSAVTLLLTYQLLSVLANQWTHQLLKLNTQLSICLSLKPHTHTHTHTFQLNNDRRGRVVP